MEQLAIGNWRRIEGTARPLMRAPRPRWTARQQGVREEDDNVLCSQSGS